MTTYDNTYSRFIAWAKVILPLVALGILSTLFLFSRNVDPTQAIPYSQVDVEELAREQRVGAPSYSGVTRDGSAISFEAGAVRPDPNNPRRIAGTTLSAIIETPAGSRIDLTAPEGTIDAQSQIASLRGGVELYTSTGYHVTTSAITAALDQTSLETAGHVAADGPLGELSAGQMILEQQDGDAPSYVLVFKDGVKLIYDPKD